MDHKPTSAVTCQVARLTAERNNAEKREYDLLGRANALAVELKATQARLATYEELLRDEIALRRDLLAALQAMLALDEEHHQRGHDDDDVCSEVQAARAAAAKAAGTASAGLLG